MFVTKELTQDETDGTYEMFTKEDQSNEPTQMQVLLNGCPCGHGVRRRSVSLNHQSSGIDWLKQHDATLTLHPSATRILTYTGEPIPIVDSAVR